MVRKTIFLLITVMSLSLVVDSCRTSKQSTRKCDGRKGQRTPMGNI